MNGMPGLKGSVRESEALDAGGEGGGHQLNFQPIDPLNK